MRKRLFFVGLIVLLLIPLVISIAILTSEKNNSPTAKNRDDQAISPQTMTNIRKKLISGPAGNQNLIITEAKELLKQDNYKVIEVIINEKGAISSGIHLFTVTKEEEVLIKPTDEWDPILENENLPNKVKVELKNRLIQSDIGSEDL